MDAQDRYWAPKARTGRQKGGGTPPPFAVACDCGQEVGVTASDAGSRVACECGREVLVPRLSQLRASTGADPYETSAVQTIARLLATGELPGPAACAWSGEPTDDVLDVVVMATSSFAPQEGSILEMFAVALLTTFLLPISFIAAPLTSGWVPYGQQAVRTPLRMAYRFHEQARRARPNRLEALLRTVPVYAALLDEFPRTDIFARKTLVGGPTSK